MEGSPDVPRYRTLANELAAAISNGAYGAATKLPSEAALAKQYGVSRGTVRQAMAQLRARGTITSRRGTRRLILDTAPSQGFLDLISFTRWAHSVGEAPGARTITVERRAATPAELEQLRLSADAEVYFVVRLRTLGRQPVMLERTTYPIEIGETIAGLNDDARSHVDPLVSAGVVFTDTDHVIDAVAANSTDARILGCETGSGLLRERRRSTDPIGVPILASEDRFLPGVVTFSVHNSAGLTPLARRRA